MDKDRNFSGVWDAERVLQNYLCYANKNGVLVDLTTYEDSPYKIRQRRFLAALRAYGRDEERIYDSYHSDGRACRLMLSKTRSQAKMDEFRALLKQYLSESYDMFIDSPLAFNDEWDIQTAFEKLFEFRKGLYSLEHLWSGVLECSYSIGMVSRAMNTIYSKHIKDACDTIDRMLVLLMGDDFDRSFTEEELLQFGYPDVTDEELKEMDTDW